MTEKELQREAYLAYQDKLNLQVGDTVKVGDKEFSEAQIMAALRDYVGLEDTNK